MESSRLALALLLVVLVPGTGCYWKYRNVAGDDFPAPRQTRGFGVSAGIVENSASNAAPGAQIDPTAVVSLFAKRLQEESLFSPIVYPYTELSQARPASIAAA